jgi:hypothetical protein
MLYVTFRKEIKLIREGFEGDGRGPFKDIVLAFPRRDQTESQSYFTTGSLPPISSTWRQAP